MAIYKFKFPDPLAGLAVTVVDQNGTTVNTGTLGSATGAGKISYTTTLDLGQYEARVDTTGLTPHPAADIATIMTAPGELDLAASLAPGASETAYFAGTLIEATDGTSRAITLVAAHPLPEWVTIVDGGAVLGADAGGCFVSITGQTDFSGISGANDPDTVYADYYLKRDGSDLLSPSPGTVQTATGSATVSFPATDPTGVFIFGGTITAQADSGAGSVTTGTATHHVAVNITRVAPAPTLS